jgi:RimJ/RimL family protein N-acetyltransferase
MNISSRWIYLDNHKIENLNKMYAWSQDKDLIEIEGGNLNKIQNTIENFMLNVMQYYIEYNHENGSSFIHFGIYRNDTNELVGYIDFQNIQINLESAELSLSIPDKINRLTIAST